MTQRTKGLTNRSGELFKGFKFLKSLPQGENQTAFAGDVFPKEMNWLPFAIALTMNLQNTISDFAGQFLGFRSWIEITKMSVMGVHFIKFQLLKLFSQVVVHFRQELDDVWSPTYWSAKILF